MDKTHQEAKTMPSAKDSHSPRAASSRKKEPGGQQLPQMSSGIQTLIEKLAAHQDADVWSRIHHQQRLAQAVDEFYDYKLFVGKGKQAEKRANEYMDRQHGISEHLSQLINELRCRQRVRNDILQLTRMQTDNPGARIRRNELNHAAKAPLTEKTSQVRAPKRRRNRS